MHETILQKYSIDEMALIGEGNDASVYRVDEQRVLKIYRQGITREWLTGLQAFYDNLSPTGTSLVTPKILSVDEQDGTVYSVDRTMPGQPLSEAMPLMSKERREIALKSFWDNTLNVRRLTPAYDYYGEIVATSAVHGERWKEYLINRVHLAYDRAGVSLKEEVPGVETALAYFDSQVDIVKDVETASLVHGGYDLTNVYVNESDQVCGIADFGELTIAGDYRMEAASAVLMMELVDVAGSLDCQTMFTNAVAFHGPGIVQIIHLYRLYYCFVFLAHKETYPAAYEWAIGGLKAHLANNYTY